jgi:hypothetical protein
VKCFPAIMSEFKFACPVCGQHIKCESWQGNTVMECPTCFQKITVPQAPATEDPKFIITGTKVAGERPVPVAADAGAVAPPEKHFPIAIFVVALLLCAAVVAVFVFRGKIFKSAGQTAAPGVYQPPPPAPLPAGATMPSADSTNWTLNLGTNALPDTPVVGYISGKALVPQKIILNGDGLTIRTPEVPPEVGVTIYLRPNPIASLYGKTVVYKTSNTNAPLVNLRWNDAQGHPQQQAEQEGYALRIEFGQPVGDRLPGKIYLCTPDDMKSWVMGAFNAEIPKPR